MANTYVNKVVYGGNTIIDLTNDTILASDVINSKYFHLASGERVQGTCPFDVDSTDITSGKAASSAEILDGEEAYVNGSKVIGTMPNRGSVTQSISSKDQVITIQNGFHDGSGTIQLDPSEKLKLIAENIRAGVTIFGVLGTMTGSEDVVAQALTATPSTSSQVIVPETGYNYLTQVTVEAIPYTESDNAAGGKTVTIG